MPKSSPLHDREIFKPNQTKRNFAETRHWGSAFAHALFCKPLISPARVKQDGGLIAEILVKILIDEIWLFLLSKKTKNRW